MKQTLKQRIVPEVDERETERESSKIASYVEESLKDIAPIDGDDPLFDTDSLFSDLEEMKDMTDEFFGEGFSVPGSEGFAGDMLFEGGPSESGQETETEQLESLRDLEGMFREMGGFGGGMIEPILALEEVMGKNMAKNGAIASAVGGMSKLLKAGGATLLLGGVGLAILGGLWSTVKGMAKHSPLLQNVVEMLGMVSTFLIRPFAHMIGQMLLPIMMDLLQISAKFMSISFEEGIMSGMIYLGKTFLDAIFSIPGLIALSIVGAGGALGAAIGGAAAAKIGGTIGAILGSVVPGIGTTVGAALGATIGVTLAGILGVLTAYNLDGIMNFIGDIADSIDMVSFIAYAILGPFGLIAINFIDWIKKKWGKDIAKMVEYVKDLFNEFKNGGLSAVFNKVVEDADVRKILKDVIPRFDVWETIKKRFPGWPSIPTFNVWQRIEKAFPGWPDLSWGGWGSFIKGLDLSTKVGTLNMPSSQDVLDMIKSMISVPDIKRSDIIDMVKSEFGFGGSDDSGGGGGGDGGGGGGDDDDSDDSSSGGEGGEGRDPDDPRDAPSANPPGSLPDDDDDNDDDTWGDTDPYNPGAGNGDDDNDGIETQPGDDPAPMPDPGGPAVGLASGGIVTDTLMTYVGEGRESEVVMPLSRLDSMLGSRGSDVGSMSPTNNGGTLSDSDDGDTVDDDEIIRQLRKTNRLLRSLPDDIELDLSVEDVSKWEVQR